MGSLSDKELAEAKAQAAKQLQAPQKLDNSKNERGTAVDAGGVAEEAPPKVVYKDSPAEVERKKRKKKLADQKKVEKAEFDAITKLDVLKKMRLYCPYIEDPQEYAKSSRIVFCTKCMEVQDVFARLEDDFENPDLSGLDEMSRNLCERLKISTGRQLEGQFLPTLESARLDLERRGIKAKDVTLWLGENEKGEKVIKNLNPSSKEEAMLIPDDVSGADSWIALIYNDGLRDIVYPIPPPVDLNRQPPLIDDCDWLKLVDSSRASSCQILHREAIGKLSSEIPIPNPLAFDSILNTAASNALLNDCSEDFQVARRELALALKYMGLLEYDKQNGMCYLEGDDYTHLDVVADTESNTYGSNPEEIADDDPRSYWRDLPETLTDYPEATNSLREKVQALAWVAFQAGREAERHEITNESANTLLNQERFEAQLVDAGGHRKGRNAHFEDAAKELLKQNDELPKGAALRDFIKNSENAEWTTALSELDKNSHLNVLNGVLRRL